MSALTKTYLRIRENKGQTMAEYGLIVALVAIATVVAWTSLGTSITSLVTSLVAAL